ncbi:hypothetical protein Tco_0558050 [Tanacetum coccineum]
MGGDLQGEDFESWMVEMINERKKKFAEERARAKRNKPMTQSQLRSYMSNYLKNQGTWKLAQLKKLTFDEVKAEFEKLVKQVDEYEPINFEVTKEDLKRFGEELQSKVVKKQKTTHDEAQVSAEEKIEEEMTPKKTGKRVKCIARKGVHSKGGSSHKDDDEMKMWLSVVPDEDKEGDYEPLGSRFPIIDWRTVHLRTAPQSDKGKEPNEIYQNMITRSNGSKRFFSNIMTVLSRINKEDINAIHRLVMDKYRENEPEGFDRILWGDLRVMYNPSPNDALWISQHAWKIDFWKLHESSRVHTIMTDIGIIVYMLVENRYPLERSVLSQMLDLKLQAKDDSETALELIKFIKKQFDEMNQGDEKDA